MNQQKFRAWDKKTNSFIWKGEGFSLYGESFFLYGFAITNQDSSRSDLTDYANSIVFQQCTGIKDRNGKEIYEGDIVRESHYANGKPYDVNDCVVVFDHGSFVYDFCQLNIGIYPLFTRRASEYRQHEVVGNIYEGITEDEEKVNE